MNMILINKNKKIMLQKKELNLLIKPIRIHFQNTTN
jgi:hypothetical protein